jgi:hypothetical protein
MADITNKNISIPGVNSATNFALERAYMLDFGVNADIADVGTHDLVKLPDGEALTGLKVIVIEPAASGGAATAQFKVNGSAVNSTAIALAGMGEGMVQCFSVSGVKAYGENTLQLTVGSAAYTGGKLLVIAETIPAKMFVTAG